MLPISLPTSVEGNIGYIRYSVAVHIDKPLWPHQRFQEYFTVIKALNLNDEINLRVSELQSEIMTKLRWFWANSFHSQCPLVKEERNSFFTCCSVLCCQSGTLVLRGSVPVRGYVPGQTIDFLLEINNSSALSVQNFFIQFVKVKKVFKEGRGVFHLSLTLVSILSLSVDTVLHTCNQRKHEML